MKPMKLIATFGLMTLLLVTFAGEAMAQRRSSSRQSAPVAGGFKPYMELSATYGSMWGGNIDITYSGWGTQSRKIRAGTGPSYGLALDYNIHPMQAIEISYTRQDGSLDYDYQGLTTLSDMSVNFWQIGSVRTLKPGKFQPFVLLTLGATYFSPSESTAQIDGETVYLESSTKFSFTMGLGFKTYFGEAEKVGLRATFKALPTFYNTWGGVYFGTGGASAGVSGNAIWQWEAAAGLTVKFGT